MDIYQKIDTLAKANNMNVASLEASCGLKRGTIYGWHKSTPAVDKLYKVASFLDTPIEYFVYDKEIEKMRDGDINITNNNLTNSSINVNSHNVTTYKPLATIGAKGAGLLKAFYGLSLADQKTIIDMIDYLQKKGEK